MEILVENRSRDEDDEYFSDGVAGIQDHFSTFIDRLISELPSDEGQDIALVLMDPEVTYLRPVSFQSCAMDGFALQ